MTTRAAALAATLILAACSPKDNPTAIEPEAPVAPVVVAETEPENELVPHDEGLAEVAPVAARGQDCFGLYYGYGGAQNLVAARTCFAHEVVEEPPCNGSSPGLSRLFLAVMKIDGQGGPVERDLDALDGCFEDVSVLAVGELLAESPTGAVDFCADIGGTTLSMNECAWVDVRRASAEQAEAQAELVERFGHGHELVAAGRIMEDAVAAEGNWVSDVYRSGTLRTVVDLAHRVRRYDMRSAMLRELAGKTFDPGPGGDVGMAYYEALGRVRDAEHHQLLVSSQRAWQRYAAAELAWVRRAGLPVDAVRHRLRGERAAILAERDPRP